MYWLLGIVAFVFGLIYGVLKYLQGNDDYWSRHGLEGVKSSELITVWERMSFKYGFQDLDKLYYNEFKTRSKESGGHQIKCGGIMEFRRPVLFVFDKDLIKSVMVKDFDHFVNRRLITIPENDPSHFGKSLLVLENQEWKDMRTTLSPSFSTSKIRRMFEIFTDSAQQMTAYIRAEIKSSAGDVEFKEVSGRFTMNVIASSAFGVESNAFKDKDSMFYQMGQRFQNNFSGIKILKFMILMLFPKWNKLFGFSFLDSEASGFFKNIITKTVKHRVESGEKRNDFVQLMLDTRLDTNAASASGEAVILDTSENDSQLKSTKTSKVYLTDELILAQSILFFLGGFDTTETLMIYTAYELALNPEIQEKLASEIAKAIKNDGKLTYEVVNSLEYLDMVVNETLRKYPPGIRIERRCSKAYKLPGQNYTVRKEDMIIVPAYAIHYDEDIYPNPDKFDPTRFSSEAKAQRSPYFYMPFGLGPRNCIAMRFALTEAKAAIAELIKSFVLEPTTKTTIPMEYVKTAALKPVNGMWLKFTART